VVWIQKIATTAIPGEMNKMWGLMKQLEMTITSCLLLAMLLISNSAIGQELVKGSITYLSRDRAYIDLR